MVAILLGADNGFFYAGQIMHFSSPFTVFLIYHKHRNAYRKFVFPTSFIPNRTFLFVRLIVISSKFLKFFIVTVSNFIMYHLARSYENITLMFWSWLGPNQMVKDCFSLLHFLGGEGTEFDLDRVAWVIGNELAVGSAALFGCL